MSIFIDRESISPGENVYLQSFDDFSAKQIIKNSVNLLQLFQLLKI